MSKNYSLRLTPVCSKRAELALMARLNARSTGDQEVAGSVPAESATVIHEIDHKYFYGHSLPCTDSRRAVVSFRRKNVHNTG